AAHWPHRENRAGSWLRGKKAKNEVVSQWGRANLIQRLVPPVHGLDKIGQVLVRHVDLEDDPAHVAQLAIVLPVDAQLPCGRVDAQGGFAEWFKILFDALFGGEGQDVGGPLPGRSW